MDADSPYRPRMTLTELWRTAPWWERTIYLLAILLFVLAFLGLQLTEHPEYIPAAWRGDGILLARLNDIDLLLLVACFPIGAAAIHLAGRRRSPEISRQVSQFWSLRMVLIGTSVLFAYVAVDTVRALLISPYGFLPHPPSLADVPLFAASALTAIGAVLAAPEVIVRSVRAKRAKGSEGR